LPLPGGGTGGGSVTVQPGKRPVYSPTLKYPGISAGGTFTGGQPGSGTITIGNPKGGPQVTIPWGPGKRGLGLGWSGVF